MTRSPYILSALLQGHEDDVRSLAASTSSLPTLYSTSRDSTARTWTRHGAGGWQQGERVLKAHEGFINSVAWMPGEGADSKGFLLTGGQDTLIQVFDLDASSLDPIETLLGHAQNVCALHVSGETVVSGSWDFTARIWSTKDWSCVRVLEGHGAAVWDVLALGGLKGYEGAAVTACADGLIRLYKADSATPLLFKGHTGPVRALAKLIPDDPDCNLFASASNDGTIRIWNVAGDLLTILEGHESFIYALVSLPSAFGGGLASSGEDGIVKIWDQEEGEQEQEILVPALSVWSLATLPNGDLAIACSDNLIWVFTRDVAKKADASTTEIYETRVAARPKPQPSTASKPSLPLSTHNSLSQSGTKEGEIKLVEVDGVTTAYQWTAAGEWETLGEVTDGKDVAEGGGTSDGGGKTKMMYEGEEYDYVVDIDIADDKPALKLPFNVDDDLRTIAKAFVVDHKLPESYEDQIFAFIDRF